jgi:HEAT repeat protein
MISDELLEILPQISAENAPLPIDDFSAISDMTSEELDAFLEVWRSLGDARRRELILELGKQADEHIEFNFDLINRASLRDDDDTVRQTAIANLWECKDADLIPVYLESLHDDPAPAVRVAAADALGRYVLMGELDEISSEEHEQIENALLDIMDTDIVSLLQQSCIEALGYSSRKESELVIEAAYKSEDADIRKAAIVAMGRSYNQRWEPQVLDEMTSPYPGIRAEAARAAGELELSIAIEPLIELLDDVQNAVQESAVWSLGQIGGDRAEEALIALQELTEEERMLKVIEDALDHLAFLKGSPDFALLDFEGPDVE